MHFFRVEQSEEFMGIFLLWATSAHEYMALFVNIYGHRTSGPIIMGQVFS